MNLYNVLSNQSCALKDKILTIYYRMNLLLIGAIIGKGVRFSGRVKLAKRRNATFIIGNNFTCFSSSYKNPLCRNIHSSIFVDDNAILTIGNNVGISSVCIWCHKNIIIGNNVAIGAGSILLDSDCHSLNYIDRRDSELDVRNTYSKNIIIDDDVLIGTSCIILKGVHIGSRTVIGSGSVVTKDIPSDCIAVGNPCKVVRVNIE